MSTHWKDRLGKKTAGSESLVHHVREIGFHPIIMNFQGMGKEHFLTDPVEIS